MHTVIPFDDTRPIRVQPIVLGTLTVLTLLCTFIIDVGTTDEVVTWVPYCIAIVLALQWRGATVILPVTAAALILMVIGFALSPPGHLQTETTNRAIGAVTLTILALVCLYIDSRRIRHRKVLAKTASRLNRLRLFINSLKNVALVLTDARGRVTEWNGAAQRLTGHSIDRMIGQAIYRVFQRRETSRWAQMYRTARRAGQATCEVACYDRHAPPSLLQVVVTPLRNQVGRLYGYSLILRNYNEGQIASEKHDNV